VRNEGIGGDRAVSQHERKIHPPTI
jgi:hypothetical protein